MPAGDGELPTDALAVAPAASGSTNVWSWFD
jgi:hypothetical protein